MEFPGHGDEHRPRCRSGAWATLAVGMWKVTVSGAPISLDAARRPDCTAAPCASGAAPGDQRPGVNPTSPTSHRGGTAIRSSAGHAERRFRSQTDEHLYVQFRRHRDRVATLATRHGRLCDARLRTTASRRFTHPAANASRTSPTLSSRLGRPSQDETRRCRPRTPIRTRRHRDALVPALLRRHVQFSRRHSRRRPVCARAGERPTRVLDARERPYQRHHLLLARPGDRLRRPTRTSPTGHATSSFVYDTTPPGLPTLRLAGGRSAREEHTARRDLRRLRCGRQRHRRLQALQQRLVHGGRGVRHVVAGGERRHRRHAEPGERPGTPPVLLELSRDGHRGQPDRLDDADPELHPRHATRRERRLSTRRPTGRISVPCRR